MNPRKLFASFGATIVLALLAACSINPLNRAETREQQAFALYGTFVVFQEQAVRLVKDPNVPEDVKQKLRQADAVAYPVADGLFKASQEVIAARRALAEGTGSVERLDIALTNFSLWYTRARPVIIGLVNAVKGG